MLILPFSSSLPFPRVGVYVCVCACAFSSSFIYCVCVSLSLCVFLHGESPLSYHSPSCTGATVRLLPLHRSYFPTAVIHFFPRRCVRVWNLRIYSVSTPRFLFSSCSFPFSSWTTWLDLASPHVVLLSRFRNSPPIDLYHQLISLSLSPLSLSPSHPIILEKQTQINVLYTWFSPRIYPLCCYIHLLPSPNSVCK